MMPVEAYAVSEAPKVHILRPSYDCNQPTVFVAKEKFCGPFSTFSFIFLILTFFPAAFCGTTKISMVHFIPFCNFILYLSKTLDYLIL
jgi:hypothetical protein